jgi:thiol-disulfide isomerase/thioredoxin
MWRSNRAIPLAAIVCLVLVRTSLAQETPAGADPAALEAFTQLIKAYRERPALHTKTTVKIELSQGEAKSNSSELKAEFTFSKDRRALIKLRGFTCHVTNGTLTAVHESNEHSYFSTPDDGSPYYTLMNAFVDIPFPELAIHLGEESIDDVLMQFHPKAPYVQPSSVATEIVEGKTIQRLKLTSDNEVIDIAIDPDKKLIQSMELTITGGDLVQPGSTLAYKYLYEHEVPAEPIDDELFTFNSGDRQRVDVMASLPPKPQRQPGQGDVLGGEEAAKALVGEPAPPVVLATADGNAVDLEDLRGQVVVLDFWASWCGPCMSALPVLHEVAQWSKDQQLPVKVLTINVWEIRDPASDNPDARLESAKKTWEKRGFTLPIAMDYTDEVAQAYRVRGIPTTVVIRADGNIHAIPAFSQTYGEDLKREIQDAIKAVEADEDEGHGHGHEH